MSAPNPGSLPAAKSTRPSKVDADQVLKDRRQGRDWRRRNRKVIAISREILSRGKMGGFELPDYKND